MSNMLISISAYIVMAVSLNLVVGLLGDAVSGARGLHVRWSLQRLPDLHCAGLKACLWRCGCPCPCSQAVWIAAVFGLIIGLPALRLKGDYLAIVTLACGEIIKTSSPT